LCEPIAVEFVVDLLDEERGEVALELPFGPLELRHVLFEDVFDVALHSLDFGLKGVLYLMRALLEFFCKLLIVGHDCLFELLDF
jgi:hypothetical protein